MSGSESEQDDDVGPFISKFSKIDTTSPRREVKVSNLVMTAQPTGNSSNGELVLAVFDVSNLYRALLVKSLVWVGRYHWDLKS
jgi:hypothetical protein